MIPTAFTDVVHVTRRADSLTASRDALNNPAYGSPETWSYVYTNIKVRIAFSGKGIGFNEKGELVKPSGTLYFDKDLDIRHMDRIITVNCPGYAEGIEYVVTEVVPSFYGHGILSHKEGHVDLPI